jgi:dienelactone hydrolase
MATHRTIRQTVSWLLLLGGFSACGAAARPLAPVSRSGPTDDHAFDYDAGAAPLDIQVSASEKEDGLTVQTLTYASPKGGRVPGAMIVPDGAGPFAGVLLMHGMPGNYKEMMREGESLARRGAVVLMIDAPFSRSANPRPTLSFSERDREEQIQLIVDWRRGVDLLIARPDIDPQRIGYLGISFGGAMGGLLAGVEKRIKAFALVVGDGGLVTHFTGEDDAETSPLLGISPEQEKLWRTWMEPIEPLRWVGRAAPSHLLFQNGRKDKLVPPADGKAYQEAGSQPKTIRWYRGGHGLNEQAIRDRHAWLAAELGLAQP